MADDSESEDDCVIRPYGDSDFSAVEALWGACGLIVGHRDGRPVATVMTGHDGHRGWLAGRGVGKVNLMIRQSNEAARGFYQAIGYACEPRIVMSRLLPR